MDACVSSALNGGGCSRRLNRLCQGFPVSGNNTGNLSAISARDLTVSGEKHRIKQRLYPVEVTARGSGTANSGQIIREFRSNCTDSPGSISSVPWEPLTRYIWPQGRLAAPGNASALFQYVPLQNALTGSQRLTTNLSCIVRQLCSNYAAALERSRAFCGPIDRISDFCRDLKDDTSL